MDGGRSGCRGRGKPVDKPPQPPDKAILDKISQEKASLNPPDQASLDRLSREQEQEHAIDEGSGAKSAKTTIGEGQRPPLSEELKKKMQVGVTVCAESSKPSTVTVTMGKLNPTANDFVPKLHDPRLTAGGAPFFPSTATSGPIFNKHPIPTSTSAPGSTRLDPSSKEFVPSSEIPSSTLASISTEVMRCHQEMTRGMLNGDLNGGNYLDEEEDVGGYLSAKDIMEGFESAAPTSPDDASNKPVLQGAAEMLLKMYNYPGSFDDIKRNFKATLSNWIPSEDTLTNLAEMLIHWGVNEPDLRYSACRMCQLIANDDDEQNQALQEIATRFQLILFPRLQAWNRKCYSSKKSLATDEDKYLFSTFSGFFAEIFTKVLVNGKPVKPLFPNVYKYVKVLLEFREDFYLREACNILKLTGGTLKMADGYDGTEMNKIVTLMKELSLDKSFSQTCVSLMMQVIELSGSNWNSAASPTNPSPKKPLKGGGLNTNAAPFVPSSSSDSTLFTETFYDPPVLQQPVASASEWNDFVGDDQLVEDASNSIAAMGLNEADYDDGLDPEIELEMEAFIDEIEEHLMLQDFDPDLQND